MSIADSSKTFSVGASETTKISVGTSVMSVVASFPDTADALKKHLKDNKYDMLKVNRLDHIYVIASSKISSLRHKINSINEFKTESEEAEMLIKLVESLCK